MDRRITHDSNSTMPSMARVLLVGPEPTRLQVLSGFLTFHGFVVDVASVEPEARALFDHLEYRAVVASLASDGAVAAEWRDFLLAARSRGGATRTVALLPAGASTQGIGADLVLAEDQPIAQLAEVVCDTLAA